MAVLETEDLTYTYSVGTPFEKTAVNNVSLKIEEGEMIGVMGHTGSGKSTLIQHFNGLLRPTSGRILLDGKDIWADKNDIRSVRFKVGLVFQYPEYQIFEETVYKDIAFGPTNMGLDKTEIDRRVRETAHDLGLSEELMERSPFELSGGQKRRVAIAGVMAMEPRVLILDEPTAGLDVEARNEILDLLREYAAEDESRTILITSHIASDLEHLCDDIYLIHGGKQLLHEETDVILEQYGLIKADEAQYAALDKEYLLDTQKEPYGYACLTNDRKYYEENVPDLVVERAGIDDVILMMTGGEKR